MKDNRYGAYIKIVGTEPKNKPLTLHTWLYAWYRELAQIQTPFPYYTDTGVKIYILGAS